MAQTVCPLLSAEDRQRLAAILADRNRPQKHAARARIILHSAERLDVAAIARRAGIGRPAVWRWQQRFAEAGVDGLLRDKTRKPGKPPTPNGVVQMVVALICREPPGEANPLDGSDDGQDHRSVLADRAADLGGPPAAAPPRLHTQGRQEDPLLSAPHQALTDGLKLGELAEDQQDGLLDASIRILLDASLADRHGEEELTAARLLHRLGRALPKDPTTYLVRLPRNNCHKALTERLRGDRRSWGVASTTRARCSSCSTRAASCARAMEQSSP